MRQFPNVNGHSNEHNCLSRDRLPYAPPAHDRSDIRKSYMKS